MMMVNDGWPFYLKIDGINVLLEMMVDYDGRLFV
jgi:hypothetical protein